MNTPLTVERLNTLRAQLIAHSQREANLIDPDLCGTGVELIDAHLSPSAELGKAGEIVPWQVLGMIDNTRADLDRVTENLRQASTALYRHVDPKTEAPPPPPAAVPTWRYESNPGSGIDPAIQKWIDTPADVQAVEKAEDIAPIVEALEIISASLHRMGPRSPWVIDRAITFLQQRPFSEELRQHAARYAWLRTRINWKDTVRHYGELSSAQREWTHIDMRRNPPQSEHIDEYIDGELALLTRAAEGKGGISATSCR
jgi:hypothetical protein